jgi:hypothetical protein
MNAAGDNHVPDFTVIRHGECSHVRNGSYRREGSNPFASVGSKLRQALEAAGKAVFHMSILR